MFCLARNETNGQQAKPWADIERILAPIVSHLTKSSVWVMNVKIQQEQMYFNADQ